MACLSLFRIKCKEFHVELWAFGRWATCLRVFLSCCRSSICGVFIHGAGRRVTFTFCSGSCLSRHSVNKRFKESSCSSGSSEKDVTDSGSLEKSSINSSSSRLLLSCMNLWHGSKRGSHTLMQAYKLSWLLTIEQGMIPEAVTRIGWLVIRWSMSVLECLVTRVGCLMTCCRPNTLRMPLYRLARLSSSFSRSKLVSPVMINIPSYVMVRWAKSVSKLSNQLASSSLQHDL